MNKMLRALKKLQAPVAGAGVRPQRAALAPAVAESKSAVEVPAAETPAQPPAAQIEAPATPADNLPESPRPKVDMKNWGKPALGPAYVMQEISRKPPKAARVAEISAATPTPSQFPTPESPWERAARNDLSSPAGHDAYRAIAQQIRRDLPGVAPRTILLAGVGCGENEVAEAALRIAIIMAVDGRETLLVDAEPAHPLTNALVAETQPGLSEAILENIAAKHFLLPTATVGLRFCPAGGSLSSLANYELASLPTGEIVEQLREQSALTIITAGNADQQLTRAFGRSCDATYLLVRLGVATASQAYQARSLLQESGARLLGCIAIDGGE